ncbi:GM24523 [Drosophila sechellia]|uniref:GM24523 n=1 Tax=Drosophila sechellia TaxID=7238 RepID=B4HHU4_DROSE|nr:GM24523 [Drosophila sechellia]
MAEVEEEAAASCHIAPAINNDNSNNNKNNTNDRNPNEQLQQQQGNNNGDIFDVNPLNILMLQQLRVPTVNAISSRNAAPADNSKM